MNRLSSSGLGQFMWQGWLNRNMRSLLFTIFSNFFSGLCRDILKFCILWLWRQIEIVTNTKVAYGGERGAPLGAGKECQVGFLLIRLFSPNYQLQHLILSSRISPHSPLSRISPHLPFFSELSASTSYFCHLWIWEAKRKNGHRVKYLQTNLVYSDETLVFWIKFFKKDNPQPPSYLSIRYIIKIRSTPISELRIHQQY